MSAQWRRRSTAVCLVLTYIEFKLGLKVQVEVFMLRDQFYFACISNEYKLLHVLRQVVWRNYSFVRHSYVYTYLHTCVNRRLLNT